MCNILALTIIQTRSIICLQGSRLYNVLLSDNINILHMRVKVNRKEVIVLARKQLCAFGKEINTHLWNLTSHKEWLIEQVGKSTGRYFDRSYLHKIQVGEIATPGIVQAIREILDLPESDARSDRLRFFPKIITPCRDDNQRLSKEVSDKEDLP